MWGLYRAVIAGYAAATRVAGLFSGKARARAHGADASLAALPTTAAGTACIWMHCASVGEFEQGRPLWEALRARHPGNRFVLTFFSPSGYAHFAARTDHGEVHYLPWDTAAAARGFVERLYPSPAPTASPAKHLALFVKYEWWLGIHRALRAARVPTVLVSGAFRQNQPFFRPRHPLHGLYREALAHLRIALVQTADMRELLLAHRYPTPCVVTGDTRLDRVLAIRDTPFRDETIAAWTRRGGLVLVAGSTWPADETLLAEVLAEQPTLRLLVAPHEVDAGSRERLQTRFEAFGVELYSQLAAAQIAESAAVRAADGSTARSVAVASRDAGVGATVLPPLAGGEPASATDPLDAGLSPKPHPRVLVLDALGLLSRVYRFAYLAYVGGGFGAGIHNLLEPVVYGLPVAFGPKHQRFPEALELRRAGVGFAVGDAGQLRRFVARHTDTASREAVLAKAETFVRANRGATARALDALSAADLL